MYKQGGTPSPVLYDHGARMTTEEQTVTENNTSTREHHSRSPRLFYIPFIHVFNFRLAPRTRKVVTIAPIQKLSH